MGNTETTPEVPVDPLALEKLNPLDKRKIEADDVEYVKSVLTQANVQLECTPRIDGVGCQYTPLGWAIYSNSRQIVTHIINLPNVDVTRHVAWWYESALPESSFSPLVERVAPKLRYLTCTDLAVMLGNVEIVAEIMKLPLAWNRKFHDPLNWALHWAKMFLAFAQGETENTERAPRKIQKSEEEAQKYEQIIELLKAEGAMDEVDLDPIWEQEHTVKSIYPPKEIITVMKPVMRPMSPKGDRKPTQQTTTDTA